MKRIISVVCLSLFGIVGWAQTASFDDFNQMLNDRFNQFKENKNAEFEAFRKQQNQRYADFLKRHWEQFNLHPAVMPPQSLPVAPMVYEEEKPDLTSSSTNAHSLATQQMSNLIPVNNTVLYVPQPQPIPIPLAQVEPKADFPYKPIAISFYGTLVSVGFPTNEVFKLSGLSEEQLAQAWTQLSGEAYDVTLNNVLAARDDLALCDWGYVELLQVISEKQYGKGNEATFMQAFLLAQSGYKIRLATDQERLYVLVASQYHIFSMPYFMLDGIRFYPLNNTSKQLYISSAAFDKEQSLSLQLRQEQNLDVELTIPRKLTSKYGIIANVSVNKNSIDFFNHYPSAYISGDVTTQWILYANTPLEQSLRESLYPVLKQAISGLNEQDAVNKILNFVQTAFDYEYDNIVWGGERVFFATETLYYPYSDCEDRSILFARLIRDIIGLDVVLLYYPGHLATAVAFNQEVVGDYLIYNNRKYVVCDPTYIGAPVGYTMAGMNNQEAQIIVL